MRDLSIPTCVKFRDALHRTSNTIKRTGGMVLAGAIITAVGFQAAPADKAFAAVQPRQEVNVKATGTKVIDYCSDISGSTPSTLKKHGVKIVVRYVGYQSGKYAWKNLKKSEVSALRKQGIDIVAVYETTTGWMRGGYQAGVSAAKTARADIIRNGGPKDPFVYFACDEDAGYTGQVNATLRGAASVLGRDKVGIYGSYKVVDSALKSRAAAKAWQTEAWSQGRVGKDIALYQTVRTSAGALGLDYDSNLPKKDDIGQWGRHDVTPAPVHAQAVKKRSGPARVASKPTPASISLAELAALFFGNARS